MQRQPGRLLTCGKRSSRPGALYHVFQRRIAVPDATEKSVPRSTTKTRAPRRATIETKQVATKATAPAVKRKLDVLLVGVDAATTDLIGKVTIALGLKPRTCDGIGAAKAELSKRQADLMIVNATQPDGAALGLVRELTRGRQTVPALVLTGEPTLQGAVEAMRAGAMDYLALPLSADELRKRLDAAVGRLNAQRRHSDKLRRLRGMCHKLNHSRREMSEQVNVLCGDLVAAYQDLADQMQQVLQSTEFNAVIRNELDLEQLVRKTLEYLLDKVGPTNAVIFLPASSDEYSLGGYVNYDCDSQPSEILLEQMGDVVAPRIAEKSGLIHITDDSAMRETFGEDFDLLRGSQLLGVTCVHEEEALAVVSLFRDGSEPYDDAATDMLTGVASALGTALARIIRVHHRGNPAALE